MITLKTLSLDSNDINFTFKARNNKFVAQGFPSPPPVNIDLHKKWISKKLKDERCCYFLIIKNREPIGLCWLEEIINGVSAEFGLYLLPIFSNTGESIKVFTELFDIGFAEYDLKYIFCETLIKNKTVISLHKSLKMKFKEDNIKRGSKTFAVSYMTRENYKEVRLKWNEILKWIENK